MVVEQPRKKVIIHKKMNRNKKSGIVITDKEYNMIKNWMITGSFSNNFFSDKNKLDTSKLFLLRRAILADANKVQNIMLNNSLIAVNKDTLVITLVLLSNGNFNAKKAFKDSFNKIIKSPNDLYKFLFILKKYRGIGSLIHTTIKKWISNHDVNSLEKMFVEERSKYSWSGQDLIRIIKPKPRDKKESLLFKWIVKNEISEIDISDYQRYLPLIYFYERLRINAVYPEELEKNIGENIGKYKLSSMMIPGNVYRTDNILEKLLDLKSPEELVKYSKNHLKEPIVIKYLTKVLSDHLSKEDKLNINVLELLSIYNNIILENIETPVSLITILDQAISYQLKTTHDVSDKSFHIIDMSEKMFASKNNVINTTPAVIASIMSRGRPSYSFSGNKIKRETINSVYEAEGKLENSYKINLNRINLVINSLDINTIFVWTNTKYLNEIEKELEYFGKKCCLVNLGDYFLKTKDNDYYTINGFNFTTRKFIKLIEKTL